ncbi:MAG: DUF2085 domain-containing protein [Euryarchaeota archaeon]|nr:DUF2085 domain-containing protein [Euryarchaeota archaeon]
MKGKRVVLGLWLVNLAWTLAMVATPLALPAGTVRDLHGHANVVDHDWSRLPWVAGVVYFLGDLNCHQIAARSWELGGNQMPVDARMAAGFVAGNLGIALAFLVPTLPFIRDEAPQILPRPWRARLDSPRRRLAALIAMAAFAAAPLLLDVALQGGGLYESTNLRRAWTGALFGLGVGYLVAVLFDSLMAPAPDAPGKGSPA